MRQLHLREKEQFRKLFQKENVDQFEDRFLILEIFLTTESHLTVEEIGDLLSQHGHTFSLSFIIETLKMMCDYGFAQKNRFENGDVRYEHRHPCHHHDHIICTKCGRIVEFENNQLEQLQVQIVNDFHFHMLQHKMEIYGICDNCMQTLARKMPLAKARPGERVKIKSIKSGRQAQTRLQTMGLGLGDIVEVIAGHPDGQMVVSVDCKRFILGHGVAGKIMVEYTQDYPGPIENVCLEPFDEK